MTTLDVGQDVLFHIVYDWIPGVIASVQEHVHADDNDLQLPLAGVPLQLIQQRAGENNVVVMDIDDLGNERPIDVEADFCRGSKSATLCRIASN
jgi:hypothetical protein